MASGEPLAGGSAGRDRVRAAIAAEVVGVCQRALDMTVEYVKERKQFGVPVGSFQAVSHRCAQMLLHTESARSTAYFAAWAADADQARLPEAAALAAAAAADGGRDVTASAIQAHGGIGFTWEADVHWLYKRAQLDAALLGGAGTTARAWRRSWRPTACGPSPPDPPDDTSRRRTMGVLDDKVAIVTGIARGIGRATAELLASQGAKVVDQRPRRRRRAADRVEIAGETVVFGGDLTKEGGPEALVQSAIDAWGKVDIIVNNAGYTLDGAAHKISDEWFQRMLDIHLVVPFQIIRAAAPHLREPAKAERDRGEEVFRKIVNVSSTSGMMGNAGQANYSSGKAGVVGLTKTLAKEWGQFKVNVNAVAFGFIETRLTAAKDDEQRRSRSTARQVQLGIPEQIRGMAAGLIPLGRPGTPEEAAGGVFFLCSPWSNYVHGQVLNITGGILGGMVS